jgi:hypothetical protein
MEKEWAGKQTNRDVSWVTANIIDDLAFPNPGF